jgi:cytoskeletal protein CcmA (bactofilin family)
MFKSAGNQGELNGFLDAGSHMNGELHFEDTFRIEGKLTGSVVSDGKLVVGDGGDVEGDLRVRHVIVLGTVRGTLRAAEKVEIAPSGKVLADLHTPSLVIEEGAYFEGNCSMKPGRGEGGGNVARIPVAKG